MGHLKNRVALVTGASSGIGAELARAFSVRGFDVALVARRIDRLRALQEDIESRGSRALAVAADVIRDGELDASVARILAAFGRLDVVVANAGFGVSGRVQDLSIDDFRRQFETNVYGVLRTLYACLPALKETKGIFAVVGSVSGHVSTPGTAAYAMSKFSVRALTDALRVEMKPYGVGVTLISPGFVRSEIRKVDNAGRVNETAKDPVPDWLQMPTDVAARKAVRAILRRKRERILTAHGYVAVWLQRFFPGFLNWVLGRATLKTRANRL